MGYIIGVIWGIMEKKTDATISKLGLYWDDGTETGNHYVIIVYLVGSQGT